MVIYDEEALELFVLLKELEYTGTDEDGNPVCHNCHAEPDEPHEDDCTHDKWLRRLRHI